MTDVNVRQTHGGYTIDVTRRDGETLPLHFGTRDRAATVAFFLLEAFSQEHTAALEAAHKRVMATLDKCAAVDPTGNVGGDPTGAAP